ncbi:hypothetical protein [Isoptericola variabilis]|uniref:Uncharacterized protein n=1 Tax=Isoptericola variabilis (strain 225) TaxID=743718 RepID=F6FST5_ISOV2|nr:hypothetical protein [Isoptericola variabilis]AEG43076.1 hypothetical protein Isova_0273 [Isoptericola variabilis 225]TWH35003.1 hypothetical protein L600_000100000070 [Isoptericola variabilis J7]
MSETDEGTYEGDDRPDEEREQTDASELSDEGVGGTMTEPNTMEPEEGLPEEG